MHKDKWLYRQEKSLIQESVDKVFGDMSIEHNEKIQGTTGKSKRGLSNFKDDFANDDFKYED